MIQILLGVVGIVMLVCWLMTLIKIFKQSIGLGILGIICGLFAFIYGWIKVGEMDHKNVMVAWTIAALVGIVLNVVYGAEIANQLLESMPTQ